MPRPSLSIAPIAHVIYTLHSCNPGLFRISWEVIVGNATAFVVYAAPETSNPGEIKLNAQGGTLAVWTLAGPNN